MGGPPVSDQVKALLVDTWRKSVADNREMTAKEVLQAVKSQLSIGGNGDITLPKLRKVQDILREARERFEYTKDQDIPWSMATIERYPLPPEAIPKVLRIWKLLRTEGKSLVLREAKWIARLHLLASKPYRLFGLAEAYANNERLSELLGIPFDTANLDISLVSGENEHTALRLMAETSREFEESAHDEFLEISKGDGGLAAIHAYDDFFRMLFQPSSTKLESSEYIDEYFAFKNRCPKYSEFDASEETKWRYAHWVQYLSKSPKIQSLSIEEALNVIERLKDWVCSQPTDSVGEGGMDATHIEIDGEPLAFMFSYREQLAPALAEILRDVGCEIETDVN
ncbi:MAG: hypothetical protein HQ553_18180 [Chloroflexi bacterium]|nr:hypothetical protein [Chloroflexota bacterium]